MQALVPGDNFIITWLIIGALSAWGGLVRYILDKNNEEDEWSWVAVISQIIVSGFTGLIGGLLAFEGGTSRYMTFALAGLFGAMGNSALQYLWQRFFSQEIPPKE